MTGSTSKRTREGQLILNEFADRFKVWLQRSGENPVSYAAKIGVDLSEISKIMAGKRNLSLIVASKMISGFEISLQEFFVDRNVSELEKRFGPEVKLFIEAITVADAEAMMEIRKTLHRAIKETKERRKISHPRPHAL